MKLHLVSLPHTETTNEFITCAYTQKVVKFGKMMTDFGYEVILYSGEENDTVCAEHVPCFSREERERWYGKHDQNGLWGNINWDPRQEGWKTMNPRVVRAIRERAERNDLVLLIAGKSQEPITHKLLDLVSCEWGVGYEGIFSNHCAFESHAWRHYLYGKYNYPNGRWYDATIPNFFDPEDFYVAPEKGDYLLFVGRLIERKGPAVAADVAKELGMRLIVAGPGGEILPGNRLRGLGVELEGDHIEYVGPVDAQRRSELMAGAVALMAPTYYIEPFGGVTVEAMLSGTPAVTSDWGAFSENVLPGQSGYRFRTLAEGVRAVRQAAELDPQEIRRFALDRFSFEAVAPQFDGWFRQLDGLWGQGFYEPEYEVVDDVRH